ncbi:response regulator [Candidatus Pacearchaeota archaeon]|nr:response regulator [Candidatus Pacearchaeota archaeon]
MMVTGNVLIVDSDVASLHSIAAEINKNLPGVETDEAATVEQAIAMAEASEYDLFIIDIGISDAVSGIKLAAVLKGMNGYGDAPIIFTSAMADIREKLKRDYPDIEYYDKPTGTTGVVFVGQIEKLLALFKTLTQLQIAVEDVTILSKRLEGNRYADRKVTA